MLMGVLAGTLLLYGHKVSRLDNFYINAYSSIINFFGPGQSGPAVRAAWLKMKHSISVKQYAFGTLLYYGFYSLWSGLAIVAGVLPGWLAIGVGLLGAGACAIAVKLLRQRRKALFAHTQGSGLRPYGILAGAALGQLILQGTIYLLELHSVGNHVSLRHLMIYTGTANFALFVALTPGAIGFREAFLLFTQRLHHISNNTIVAANVVDRAVYVVFLGLLLLVVLAVRAHFHLRTPKAE